MSTLNWLTRRKDEQTAGKASYRLLAPVGACTSTGRPTPMTADPTVKPEREFPCANSK